MATSKDTLYIDVEDEITAVIDKVLNAKHKIVAVVLPKKATVFQSSVNMKLLKKAASAGKKSLVLITSDKSIIAIAANAKVHVAKTAKSKPIVPDTPKVQEDDVDDEIVEDTDSKEIVDDSDEAIQLDNTEKEEVSEKKDFKKAKKNKILKIPDFSSFRTKVALSAMAVAVVIALWIVGFIIMPKANISINADISSSSVNALVIAKVDQPEIDLENGILPSGRSQVEKIDTVTVPATGEKNIGEKAVGTVNLTNCINDGEDKIIPAGTAFSSGSLTYLTTEAITLDFAIYAGNTCLSKSFGRDKDVGVIAAIPGPAHNIASDDLTSSISGIRAIGSDMNGGTTEIVKVISQEDVDKAKQELSGTSKNAALGELKLLIEEQNLLPIEVSLSEGEPSVVASPAIDKEASETKVTMTITYSMIGISEADLNELLDSEVIKNMGEKQQSIRDNGAANVEYQVLSSPNDGEKELAIQTVASVGPNIDLESLKSQVIGKKRGDIEKLIESIDGVRSVSVEYSPAWVTTTPKSVDKITITFNEE